jgi:hypothetical protein
VVADQIEDISALLEQLVHIPDAPALSSARKSP